MLLLMVTSGPDKGRLFELSDNQPVVLGRETAPLNLSDQRASRNHAKLWCDGGRWYVQDLGSRHGTFKNNKPCTDPTPLKDGDRIRVGNSMIVMARMSVEQAERLALIGSPELNVPALPQPAAISRRVWIGAAAVVAAILGINVAVLVTSMRQNDDLRRQLAQVQRPNLDDQAVAMIRDGLKPELAHAQPLLDQILAEIRSRPQVTGEELAVHVRDAMQPELAKSQPVLDQILDQVKQANAKPTIDATQLAAEIRDAMQPQFAQSQPVLQEILDTLKNQPQQLDETLAEKMREAMKSQFAQAQPLWQDILNELKSRPTGPDEQWMTRLQELASADSAQSGATESLLNEILSELRSRPQPSPEQFADQVAVVLRGEPNQSEPLLRELLDEVRNRPAPAVDHDRLAGELRKLMPNDAQTQTLLEQVLSELQSVRRDQTTQLVEALRTELAAHLAEQIELASTIEEPLPVPANSIGVAATGPVGVAQAQQPQTLGATELFTSASAWRWGTPEGSNVWTLTVDEPIASQAKQQATQSPRQRTLTAMQQIYKTAFETDEPQVIGGGIDPRTGQPLTGRVLDPRQAKAEGIESWQQWYNHDRQIERERLLEQAERFRSARKNALPEPIVVAPLSTGSANKSDAPGWDWISDTKQHEQELPMTR